MVHDLEVVYVVHPGDTDKEIECQVGVLEAVTGHLGECVGGYNQGIAAGFHHRAGETVLNTPGEVLGVKLGGHWRLALRLYYAVFFDLFLQLHKTIQEGVRAGWTAGYVDVHWDNAVDPWDHRIGLVVGPA